MAEEQYSSQIKIDKCILSKADGSKKEPLTSDMIISYTAQESILSPFMTANIILSDSKNVLNNFPIQGGENLEFSVKTSWSDKSPVLSISLGISSSFFIIPSALPKSIITFPYSNLLIIPLRI